MKQVFWFLCAIIVPALIGGSLVSVAAQTSSPTPDPFTVQITSIPSSAFNTVIGDISANGRFVVFVSNGNLSTEKTQTGTMRTGIARSFCSITRNVAFSRSRIPRTFQIRYRQSESDSDTEPNSNAESDTKSGANTCESDRWQRSRSTTDLR